MANYIAKKKNKQQIAKEKNRVLGGLFSSEQYRGDNYVPHNCSYDPPIHNSIPFYTRDGNYRIEIKKRRPAGTTNRIHYIFTIYDNNWKPLRNYDPKNPYYYGELFSFTFLENDISKDINELKMFIDYIWTFLYTRNTYEFVLPRKSNENFKYYGIYMDLKMVHYSQIMDVNPKFFENKPFYYEYYYNIEMFRFNAKIPVDSANPNRYRHHNRMNEINLYLDEEELNQLINLCIYSYSANENTVPQVKL